MERSDNRRPRKRIWHKNKQKNENSRGDRHHEKKQRTSLKAQQQAYENQQAIQEFKQNKPICACCGEPIADMISALADRQTGEPVHFDCVLHKLRETESLKIGESISYIGQGRFAVVVFENSHDLRRFTIKRVIEWETRDKKYAWRSEIAGLYSKIR